MVADEEGNEYADNDERAIFYARGVLETVKKLRWCPEIIHCHGWMSAFAGMYIKKAYNDEPSFRDSKVVYSTYGDDFQHPIEPGLGARAMLKGLEQQDLDVLNGIKSCLDMEKMAVAYSDGLILNSENCKPELAEYAKELNIPILPFQADDAAFKEACSDFYDEVWSAGKE